MAYSNLINCYSKKITAGAMFLIPKEESVDVTWGTVSILDANLLGYRRLLESTKVLHIHLLVTIIHCIFMCSGNYYISIAYS